MQHGAAPGVAEGGEVVVFPLSFAQLRLWLLDRMDPGSAAYNIPGALRRRGPLDPRVVARALSEIVARHEALRTRFGVVDGEPVQLVFPPAPVRIPVHDLAGLPVPAREVEARRLAVAEGRTPFDLERGPLLRARLLRLAPEEHLLLLTFHHIVSDGWSTSVFRHELAVLVRAFAAGGESPLPELPIQYGDYAVWQREELAGEALEAQVSFWRAELEGAPPALELPLDRPRPPVRRARGSRLVVDVSPDTCGRLAVLARTEGATPFMVLLAASGVLLGRYGATEDLVIGTPITGRTQEELEGLIGFFVNTLAIRVDLGGDPHFPDLLGRVRTRLLAAYAHPDLPFDRVVDELRVPRDPGRTPVFQVMFVLQGEEEGRAGEAAGGEKPDWNPEPVRTGTAKVDLALSFVERSGRLAVTLDYDADLFDRSTVERLGRHLRGLLDGLAADPRRRLSGLPMLSPREEEQILVEWNGERMELPWAPVHRQFVERAGWAPGATAAVIGDEVVSYGELEARSARLAHRLRAEGVGPECRVALLAGRSPELLAGMLAILRAGGAYVPLDPAAPGERVAFVLRDSGAGVLLVQEHLRDLASGFDGRVLALADEPAAGPPLPDPDPEVPSDSLAYVIYTSGSTGTPKGVMVPHGALANLVRAEVDLHGFGPSTRLFSALPVSFDASVGDVFPVLVCGGALVWHPAAAELSAEEMLRYVRRHGVDAAGLPVALWSHWLDGLETEPEGGLTALPATTRVGGESLPLERARTWLRLAGGSARLFNHYGPTETTVAATLYAADDVDARATVSGSVPIGRPLPNTAAYVLDSHLRPVPVGVAGELFVGGVQVARGYQGRPDLTAERFLPDPFRGSTGARMYRTGDRVRWLPDGVLEFLGRTDGQVKIRGFRVELAEVEAALRTHSGVREAAVVAGKGPDGASRLVGYVACAEAPGLDASALRAHLRGRLPDYMVPSALVVLPSLPLTSHGKVDRWALPEPPEEWGGVYRAPRTPLEEALAAVWGEVLGVGRVGVHDDFFDLGGHSLAASRVVARIRERLGHEVSLAELFRSATVERLAQRLKDGVPAELPPSIVRLREGAGIPFFCVHAAGGMALAYLRLARRLDDRPVYGLQARGLAPGEAPSRSVEEMAARYVDAVRAVQPRGPYLLGGWSVGGVVAFEMARRLYADGEKVALLALIDSWAPLDGSRPAPPDDADLFALMAADLGVRVEPGALTALREELRALPSDARFSRFEGWLRRVEPGLRDTDPEGLRRRLGVYRATGDAAFAYRAGPYAGRVTLFRADRSAAWEIGDLSSAAWERDPRLRWRELTSAPLEVHGVGGSHHSIVVGPDVEGLAAALRGALATASPSMSRPARH